MIEDENPFGDEVFTPRPPREPLPGVVCKDCGEPAFTLCGDEHGGPEVPVCWGCGYSCASWMP